MLKLLGMVAMVLAFASTAWAADAFDDAMTTNAAERAVEERLRDPNSASFRNVVVYQPVTGARVVCGEVNGHNGFGGYAGYTLFMWAGMMGGTALIGSEIGHLRSLCKNGDLEAQAVAASKANPKTRIEPPKVPSPKNFYFCDPDSFAAQQHKCDPHNNQ